MPRIAYSHCCEQFFILLFSSLSPFSHVIFLLFQHSFHLKFCRILYDDLLSFQEVALIFLHSFFLNLGFPQFPHSLKSVHRNICQLIFQTKPQMYNPKFLINPRQLYWSVYIQPFECFFAFKDSKCFFGSKSFAIPLSIPS